MECHRLLLYAKELKQFKRSFPSATTCSQARARLALELLLAEEPLDVLCRGFYFEPE
jgi:hypothetical protein